MDERNKPEWPPWYLILPVISGGKSCTLLRRRRRNTTRYRPLGLSEHRQNCSAHVTRRLRVLLLLPHLHVCIQTRSAGQIQHATSAFCCVSVGQIPGKMTGGASVEILCFSMRVFACEGRGLGGGGATVLLSNGSLTTVSPRPSKVMSHEQNVGLQGRRTSLYDMELK